MSPIEIVLFSILSAAAAGSQETPAKGLISLWPTCSDPAAVMPAARAFHRKDYREITRLGCQFAAPLTLKARAIRCESSAVDFEPAWFSYPVRRDNTLPKAICEMEVFLPNGWKAILYTHFQNFNW